MAPYREELSNEEGKDDSKREDENYRVQETEGAIAGLLGTGGLQGQGTRPQTPRARGVHGSSEVANLSAFDIVPHCKLVKVYNPALCSLELLISVAGPV